MSSSHKEGHYCPYVDSALEPPSPSPSRKEHSLLKASGEISNENNHDWREAESEEVVPEPRFLRANSSPENELQVPFGVCIERILENLLRREQLDADVYGAKILFL